MWTKYKVKRITIPLALAVLASTLALAVPAQSATVGKLKVTVRLSNANPSTSTTIHATACWTNAQRGDVVELDVQSPSTLLWKVVDHAPVSAARDARCGREPREQ
jgi:hypothetical protein